MTTTYNPTNASGTTTNEGSVIAYNPVTTPTITNPPKSVNPIVQTSSDATKTKNEAQSFLALKRSDLTAQQQVQFDKTTKLLAEKDAKAKSDQEAAKQAADIDIQKGKLKLEDKKLNMLNEGGTTDIIETSQEKELRQGKEDSQTREDQYLNDFQDGIDKIKNGTFPLNPLQQAQLDSMRAEFEQLIKEQKEANKQYEGAIVQSGITGGRSRYAPEIEAGNVLNSVNVGISKVASLTSKMSSALASMEAGFQENNYKLLKESYTTYKAAEDEKQAEITSMQEKISEALKETTKSKISSSRDAAIADLVSQGVTNVSELLDYLNYYEDGTPTGGDFTSEEVKKTLDNVYKEPKAPKVVAGTVNSGTLTYSPKAASEDQISLENSRGEDGYADPTVYQRLYTAWINAGGLLKDFLSKYPPEQYVNPANTWLPPFLRPKATSTGIDFSTL